MERARVREGDVVVCVGGGVMGTRAAQAAAQAGACVLVMDSDPLCRASHIAQSMLDDISSFEPAVGNVQLWVGDGVRGLLELMSTFTPALVVPAVPGHMAAKLLLSYATSRHISLRVSGTLAAQLASCLPEESVLVADTPSGVLIVSYMPSGKVCAEECAQPLVCPITGFRKDIPMHELISSSLVHVVDRARVLVSWQLDGSGGVMGEDVRAMLDELEMMRSGDTYAVATACVCHGIVNTFEVV